MNIDAPFHFDRRGHTATAGDDDHIREMIEALLFTHPGERVNRPDFGCGVKRLVFAPNSTVAATLAQTTVFDALTRWLGSVIEVNEVSVAAVEETLEIRVGYVVRARGEKRYLNLEVTP